MRFGSWCALVALTVQLVMSFGHLHFASSAAAAALASAAAEPLAAAPGDTPTPTKHSRVADYCTICASIHLAGLEPALDLVDHIDPTLAPDQTVGPMATAQRFQ